MRFPLSLLLRPPSSSSLSTDQPGPPCASHGGQDPCRALLSEFVVLSFRCALRLARAPTRPSATFASLPLRAKRSIRQFGLEPDLSCALSEGLLRVSASEAVPMGGKAIRPLPSRNPVVPCASVSLERPSHAIVARRAGLTVLPQRNLDLPQPPCPTKLCLREDRTFTGTSISTA